MQTSQPVRASAAATELAALLAGPADSNAALLRCLRGPASSVAVVLVGPASPTADDVDAAVRALLQRLYAATATPLTETPRHVALVAPILTPLMLAPLGELVDATVGSAPAVAVMATTSPTAAAVRALHDELLRELALVTGTGRRGLVPRDELVVPLMLAQLPAPVRTYLGGMLAPLLHGEAGEVILDTVRAWCAHNANTEATAATLGIHVNTVRYRLGRFAELTHWSPHHDRWLIELALRWREITQGRV